MEHLKKNGRIIIAIFLVLSLCFTTEVECAAAKTKISNCNIEGAGKYGGKLSWYFTKLQFKGKNVILKGRFQAKLKGKIKNVKKLTIPLSSKCKFYDGETDGLKAADKSEKIKQYQKLDFIWLTLTVKKGKAVQFVDGA